MCGRRISCLLYKQIVKHCSQSSSSSSSFRFPRRPADRPTRFIRTVNTVRQKSLLRDRSSVSHLVVFRRLRWRLYYNKPNTLACAGLVHRRRLWRRRRWQKPRAGLDGGGGYTVQQQLYYNTSVCAAGVWWQGVGSGCGSECKSCKFIIAFIIHTRVVLLAAAYSSFIRPPPPRKRFINLPAVFEPHIFFAVLATPKNREVRTRAYI